VTRYLTVSLAVLVIVLALLFWWERGRSKSLRDRLEASTQQQQVTTETGRIADKASETTTRIIVQSESLAHEVEKAPGGDAPVPDAVLSQWSAAIGGMREQSKAGGDRGSSQPAG
jgi:hypothetical protein